MFDTNIFRGTGVAVVTPFKADKSIDWDALERILENLIANKIEYIVSLGSTGEAITISAADCQEILKFTVKVVNERIPIVAGYFGSNNTNTLLDRIKNVNLDGIDAILSSSPAYNKPSQEGIFQHYSTVAKESPLPIIIYNVPSRTSSNVSPDTILRLARSNSKFIAVKEASGDLMQSMKIIKDKPDNFLVISGDDTITLGILASGGDGVISVIANAYPFEFSEMVRASLAGDFHKAALYNNALLDLHQYLYNEGNPTGIKTCMELLGLCTREVRLPLMKGTETLIANITSEIEKINSTKKELATI
jgi:4-hydroxy-tetrahydrodipicolinate synthase